MEWLPFHLALLGYDPHKYYSGPGPFEAASLEVGLEKQDVAFLCHLVTLRSLDGKSENKRMGSHLLMVDDREEAGLNPANGLWLWGGGKLLSYQS